MDGTAQGRLAYLDGLRGIAICLVLIWHAYGPTYAQYLPFHETFSVLPIRVFWVGVELFFLISGFVIFMTLERSDGLSDFAFKRWLRLFPTMLVATAILFVFSKTGLGPYADRSAIDMIPGLIFVGPPLIHAITGLTINSMDETFWSLYVEVCFYAVFGAAYFSMGARSALATIVVLFISAFLAGLMSPHIGSGLFDRVAAGLDWIGFIHFGWFASGSFFYLYYKTEDRRFIASAIGLGALSSISNKFASSGVAEGTALLSTVGIFAATLLSKRIQLVLSSDLLVFFGSISYPLYLIHNSLTVGITQWIGDRIPQIMAPVLPILLVILASWVIAASVEPEVRKLLLASRHSKPPLANEHRRY